MFCAIVCIFFKFTLYVYWKQTILLVNQVSTINRTGFDLTEDGEDKLKTYKVFPGPKRSGLEVPQVIE